jgi:hypothetical protein
MAESGKKTAEDTGLKGKAALLEAYRASGGESTEEPDDEALYGFANDRHARLQGKYDEMTGANTRLAGLVSKDPKLAAVLSMIAGEKPRSLPYAIANIYGKDILESDPEEFEKGYQENLKRLAEDRVEQQKACKNIETYRANLEKFKSDNGLTDAQAEELNNAIFMDAENFLMGIIPAEYIDYKWKGLNYDRDVQDAADTGFVEGKNTVAEAKMKEKTAVRAIPDLTDGTGSGKVNKLPSPKRKGSFYDAFEEQKI